MNNLLLLFQPFEFLDLDQKVCHGGDTDTDLNESDQQQRTRNHQDHKLSIAVKVVLGRKTRPVRSAVLIQRLGHEQDAHDTHE